MLILTRYEQQMIKDLKDKITREKLLKEAEKMVTPIDFDDLVSKGILEKKGAWYRILDMDKLPDHAKVISSDI